MTTRRDCENENEGDHTFCSLVLLQPDRSGELATTMLWLVYRRLALVVSCRWGCPNIPPIYCHVAAYAMMGTIEIRFALFPDQHQSTSFFLGFHLERYPLDPMGNRKSHWFAWSSTRVADVTVQYTHFSLDSTWTLPTFSCTLLPAGKLNVVLFAAVSDLVHFTGYSLATAVPVAQPVMSTHGPLILRSLACVLSSRCLARARVFRTVIGGSRTSVLPRRSFSPYSNKFLAASANLGISRGVMPKRERDSVSLDTDMMHMILIFLRSVWVF